MTASTSVGALAVLLPALEEEHGSTLTAAQEAEYVALLEELPSLTLEGIRRRPAQLRATASGLQSQLLELASGSCAAFVESADCVKGVQEKMKHISSHLQQLEAVLPGVSSEAEGLLSSATRGIEARDKNTLLLERLADVLEVLEQPQLMDACVRNGFVDEALELEAAARAKAALHADVPLLGAIATQVSSYLGELQAQLLTQLAGPLVLPDALRCIGFLRRMGGEHTLSDAQLRVAFLRGRTKHLHQAEASLPRDSPVSYLLKHVELCRVHWYDAVTQYRTLFASDESPAPSEVRTPFARRAFAPAPTYAKVVPRPADAPPGAPLAVCGDDGVAQVVAAPPPDATGAPLSVQLVAEASWSCRPREAAHALPPRALLQGDALGAALLADWAAERVAELLSCLEAWLPRVQEGAFLANLLEQSAGCAASLGGVGLDFAPLLASPFREAILRTLADGLDASLEHWQQAIAVQRWSAPPPDARSFEPPPEAAAAAAAESSEAAPADPRAVALAPPLALLAHPVLAILANHLLASLNEIRQCAPYELRPDILQRLTETLVACVGVLSEAQASHAFSATAAAHFGSLVGLFSTALLPHLAAVADLLVPWRPAAGAADEGGDGGGERMVAAVRAELQPLLLPPEGAAAAPAAATPAAAAPAAAPK